MTTVIDREPYDWPTSAEWRLLDQPARISRALRLLEQATRQEAAHYGPDSAHGRSDAVYRAQKLLADAEDGK